MEYAQAENLGLDFGKGIREVPLFPEVRRVLEELYLEPDGGEFVIATNDRSSSKNLRTVFEKILRKAGVDPWPRLVQNLRSSRETELANEYPIQTVTAWLGNTPKVALENYLQVRDEDSTKAIVGQEQTTFLFGVARGAAEHVRNAQHSLATVPRGKCKTPCPVGKSNKTRGFENSASAPTRART